MEKSCYTCRYFEYDLVLYTQSRLLGTTFPAMCKVWAYRHPKVPLEEEKQDDVTLGSKCKTYKPEISQ